MVEKIKTTRLSISDFFMIFKEFIHKYSKIIIKGVLVIFLIEIAFNALIVFFSQNRILGTYISSFIFGMNFLMFFIFSMFFLYIIKCYFNDMSFDSKIFTNFLSSTFKQYFLFLIIMIAVVIVIQLLFPFLSRLIGSSLLSILLIVLAGYFFLKFVFIFHGMIFVDKKFFESVKLSIKLSKDYNVFYVLAIYLAISFLISIAFRYSIFVVIMLTLISILVRITINFILTVIFLNNFYLSDLENSTLVEK